MLIALFVALLAGSIYLFATHLRECETFDHDEPANAELAYVWRWEVSFAAMLCSIFVGALVAQFARSSLATAIGCSIGVILYVAGVSWKFRNLGWFRRFIVCAVVLHAAAIAIIPWPAAYDLDFWTAVVAIADMLLLFALLDAVRKRQRV